MNYYGFHIKSSHRSVSTEYLVIAKNEEKAEELIQKEVSVILSQKDAWIWGTPIVSKIENVKEMLNANLIFQ